MAEEMRAHLENEEAANRAAGMSLEEAQQAAHRQFGGIDQVKERCRDQRGIPWLDRLAQDSRYATRLLRRSPGFIAVALVTLALGIGVNTTAFTVLNRLMLQVLPYPEADRLVRVTGSLPRAPYVSVSPGNFCDLRAHNSVFQEIATHYLADGSLTEPGQPPRILKNIMVSADFLSVIGISPVIGRDFTASEEAHRDAEALLSNRFWREHFDADPHIVGRTIRIDSRMHTVIGVMPPVMDDRTLTGSQLDAWVLDYPAQNSTRRAGGWYGVVGRLKPGVSLSQAQAEVKAIASRLEHDYPADNANWTLNAELYDIVRVDKTTGRLIWLVLAVTSAVLVIVCVNLANLQLVRTTSRGREFAIRMALGSSRGRIVQQVLMESILVSAAGGALGLLVAKWGNGFVEKHVSDYLLGVAFPIDIRVIGFAFAVTAMTGIAFGAIPAWIATGASLSTSLKQGARVSSSDRARHRLRQVLIVSELALALVLLASAGYFVTGIFRLMDRDLGWHPDNLLNGWIVLAHEKYGEAGDPRIPIFEDHLLAELSALPGVTDVGLSLFAPMRMGTQDAQGGNEFAIDGRPVPQKGHAPIALSANVAPGWFATLGIHILQGRNFADTDRPGSPKVAIISQSMARQFWPNENPIGKRIGGLDPANPGWAEIVGVVNDITGGSDFRLGPTYSLFYRPISQNPNRFMNVTVRTATDPMALEDPVRRAIAKVDPDVAISLSTAEDVISGRMSTFFIVSRLLVEMAVLGLILSAVGIYGVIANLAAERTQEIGIRMALGAQARDVLWLVLGNGFRLAALGTAIGVALEFALTGVLGRKMPDVPGRNDLVVFGVAGLLVAVALLSSWLPARKATKLNPIDALRVE